MTRKKAAEDAELLPPHDTEAEIAVLGSMILDVGAVRSVLPILTAGDFYRAPHQEIFRAIDRVAQEDDAIDVILLREELQRTGALERVGGTNTLSRIMAAVPTSANAVHYAKIVRACARRRDVLDAARAYEAAAGNGTEEAAFRALVGARHRLTAAEGGAAVQAPLRWDLAAQIKLPEPPPAAVLVDRVFTRPTVNIVFGPAGSGKSFALLQTMLDLVMGGGAFLGHEEYQVRRDEAERFGGAPEKCLWIFGSEDSPQRMDRRSRKVFASGPHKDSPPPAGRFVYLTPPPDVFLGEPRGWDWLHETIADEKPSILVLDTVASLVSQSLDLAKNDHVAAYLRRFHLLRDHHGITSFNVTHSRKASGDPKAMKEAKADTMLGAQAWRALSDGVLLVHAFDGDTDKIDVRLLKGKDLERPIPHLPCRLDRELGRILPRDPDQDPAPSSGRPKKCSTGAVLDLRSRFPDGVPWNSIHAELGISKSTWSHASRDIQAELLTLGHAVVLNVLRWGN